MVQKAAFTVYILLALVGIASSVTHTSSQVWRLEKTNTKALLWLRDTAEHLSLKYQLDFWRSPHSSHGPVDVMIPSQFTRNIKELFNVHNLTYSVIIPDVGEVIKQQFNQMKGRKNVTSLAEFDYSVYHPYDEIHQWVKDFAAEHSDIVQEIAVSKSYEGREITGLKISVNPGNPTKKSVWFEGGIHAREWIAPATVMFITNQLVTDYRNEDATVVDIFNNLDFYIIPSLNVDGYAYTWTRNRLWRKTRSPNSGSPCVGTDPNRNWPFEWGGAGASSSPCSESYRGSEALSEVEMQGVTKFALARAEEQEFAVFIDWHSYSQLWLSPWSYSATADPPTDAKDLGDLGAAAVQAIKSVHGKEYVSGPTAQTLYEASGSSNDWGYAVLKAKYSYVVELRDQGRYGFLLPHDQIVPTGEECYAAVKVVGQWVVNEMKKENKKINF